MENEGGGGGGGPSLLLLAVVSAHRHIFFCFSLLSFSSTQNLTKHHLKSEEKHIELKSELSSAEGGDDGSGGSKGNVKSLAL